MAYKIGNVTIKNRLVLAPMSGITDIAFRVLCRRHGVGLVYTEMVNANALARNNKSTLKRAEVCEEERPVAVQLFGSRENILADAAKVVEGLGADIVDINFGCPDAQVISQGAGAALLKRPKKMGELVSALVKAVKIPVTAKIRIGIVDNQGLKTAKIIEEAGAAAIAVHGRTVKQGYSGKIDLAAIKEIKDNLNIPVIGNGDIFSGKDAKDMLDKTGCDFVMVGRGSLGNPLIFQEITDYLDNTTLNKVSDKEKIGLYFEYLGLCKEFGCEHLSRARIEACHFTKGLAGSAKLRNDLTTARTMDDIKRLMEKMASESGSLS